MKYYIALFSIFFVSLCVNAQLDTEYFNKLQTERVSSTDKVEWRQVGPGMAGYCEEFWCHPTDVNVLFMSPDMYNSYGSWDNGKSWQTIKNYDGTGKDMRRIQSIVFSHQDADFGYAIDVRGDLYNTTDRGRSWTYVKDLGGKHAELAVDPTNDNNWYIGAGDFWNVKANHRKKSDLLGYVYKYAEYGHILKSTDKGTSWQKKKNGLPSTLDVGRIIVDPNNSNNIIIATNSGVFKSIDQGENWSLSGTGLPNNLPRDMTSFYDKNTNEFILYLIEQTFYEANGNTTNAKGGIYKSLDGGANWTSITGNFSFDLTKLTNYTTQQKYWRAIGFWFDKSSTEIKNLYPNYPKNTLPVLNRLVVNPLNKNEIYISHNVKHDYSFLPGDVWKTTDGGQNWITTTRTGKYWSQNKDASYWVSKNTPKGQNTTFAHLHHEKSENEETFGNRFLEINIKGEVFICLDQQTMRSNDNGSTWNQVDDFETEKDSKHWVARGDSNLPGRFMLLETGKDGRYLFCSGEHGLWQTANLGSYEDKNAYAVEQIEGQVNSGGAHSISSVAVHPNDPNIIYTLQFRQSHRGQFRKSIDGGKTWNNLSFPLVYGGNLSSDNIFQYSLTIDPENPNNIYFCVIANPIAEVSGKLLPTDFKTLGVMKSSDEGKTWSTMNNGLPDNASVRRLKIDPANSSTLYAALNESPKGEKGGLFKTTDKAKNWSKVSIPSEIKSVNNVFIDRNTNYIFISCGRYEGTFNEGGVWRSKDNGTSWEKIFDMPYVWQTETSPINANIITVNVPLQHENKGATTYNPGAYLSLDGGKTWIKINKNLGQPDTITDLKPDPKNENVLWCALKGSGWTRGVYETNTPKKTKFTLNSTGNSCPNTKNGIITINSNLIGDYQVNIKNNSIDSTKDFSSSYTFKNLATGTYFVKITSNIDSSLAWEYSINISEPENLNVSSKVNSAKKQVSFNLKGAKSYNIKLNETTFSTSQSTINLSLKEGNNTIEIRTDKDCQGYFKKDVFISNEISAYPNPFNSDFTINIGETLSKKVLVNLYSSIGALTYSKEHQAVNGKINLNIPNISIGLFYLTVNTGTKVKNIKILKQSL
ncbi:VPS10 domain-containing protein [Lutibacter citreus]|uniref:VPS10 domain-containing protein n=1 Tax=Lutibacter citreus TaxID=2138210 RepID=UPI001300A8C0|nr:T9SS type A sorting domain-containing protein [Lutibacter citreus]